MTTATPTKLRDGSWGARAQGAVKAGDVVKITTRAGKSWTATVARVLWSDGSVTLVATASRPDCDHVSRLRASGERCAECGREIYGHGAVVPDSSGIRARCCQRCASMSRYERSYM